MKSSKLISCLEQAWFIVLGLVIILTLLPIYAILSTPFLFYRMLICKIISRFGKDLEKPVTTIAAGMSSEFIERDKTITPPRWAIVTCLIFESTISCHEIKEQIEAKWIQPKCLKNGEVKYPEFQQYIGQWCGFMFWKQDKNFCLDNHLYFHDISNLRNSEESDNFVDDLVERLLSKPFPPQRSPWEIHIVQNYIDGRLLCHTQKDRMTVFILRSHHAMADGFSIMSALVEGLFEIPSEAFTFASPNSHVSESRSRAKTLLNTLKFPMKLCHDLGYIISTIINLPKTPFHFPKGKKKSEQLFGKTQLMPIALIKEVKNNFGVSFTSVILSSIGAALGKVLIMKGCLGQTHIIFGTALPLPSHPDKMRNHATGTALELCVQDNISSEMRLLQTEMDLKRAKNTVIPLLLPIVAKMTSFHVAPVMRRLTRNEVLSAGLSNFPGPLKSHEWRDKKMLCGHFASGTGIGTQGMVFSALSYNGHIRIVLTTETEILSREQVKFLLSSICEEIFKLHKLSVKYVEERCHQSVP